MRVLRRVAAALAAVALCLFVFGPLLWLGSRAFVTSWSYPDLLPEAPDDPALPLQLLARGLEFTDPLTGAARRFSSRLRLAEVPVAG